MAQVHYQPYMMAALVQLIQTEFNESFWKVFTSAFLVR